MNTMLHSPVESAATFFANACSWRSTATSRRSRRFSCSSVSPAGLASAPLSSRCCRAQARSWSGRTSSSRPTWASDTPRPRRSATKRTASALNSGLKERRSRRPAFLLDFMRHLRSELRASEASTKSGQSHINPNVSGYPEWLSLVNKARTLHGYSICVEPYEWSATHLHLDTRRDVSALNRTSGSVCPGKLITVN